MLQTSDILPQSFEHSETVLHDQAPDFNLVRLLTTAEMLKAQFYM